MCEHLKKSPRAFISYTWDDNQHKDWVRDLAGRLREDGVDVTLDQWHLQPGDQLPAFMETAIRESDFVLIICTPKYKLRSEARVGGAGYEGDVIQAEVFTGGNNRKFIPILRTGDWKDAAPSQLLGKVYISLRETDANSVHYNELLRVLHSQVLPAPLLGSSPNFVSKPDHYQGVRTLTGHTKSVSDVKVTPDGNVAVSVSRDGTLRVWNLSTGRETRRIEVKRSDNRLEDLWCVAITADGSRAISGSATSLKFWDLKNGNLLHELYENLEWPAIGFAVTITLDGKLAVCAKACYLSVWDLGLCREVHKILTPCDIKALAVSADGCLSLSGGFTSDSLQVRHLDSSFEPRVLHGHDGFINGAALTLDGRFAVTVSGKDKLIKLWQTNTWRELRTIRANSYYSWYEILDIAVSGDGRLAATACTDNTVSLWDLETGLKLHTFLGHTETVNSVAITPDGRLVVSGSKDRTIKLWDF